MELKPPPSLSAVLPSRTYCSAHELVKDEGSVDCHPEPSGKLPPGLTYAGCRMIWRYFTGETTQTVMIQADLWPPRDIAKLESLFPPQFEILIDIKQVGCFAFFPIDLYAESDDKARAWFSQNSSAVVETLVNLGLPPAEINLFNGGPLNRAKPTLKITLVDKTPNLNSSLGMFYDIIKPPMEVAFGYGDVSRQTVTPGDSMCPFGQTGGRFSIGGVFTFEGDEDADFDYCGTCHHAVSSSSEAVDGTLELANLNKAALTMESPAFVTRAEKERTNLTQDCYLGQVVKSSGIAFAKWGDLSPESEGSMTIDWATLKIPKSLGLRNSFEVSEDVSKRLPEYRHGLKASGYHVQREEFELDGTTVVKRGAATGVTVGKVNGVLAKVRMDLDSTASMTEELCVVGLNNKPFSAKGDSGAWVYGRDGDFVGVIVGGCEKSNVSYVMPALAYFESLKEKHGKVPKISKG